MNEQYIQEYEQEIDIKRLCYRFFSKWRSMVMFGIIFAVLVGGYKLVL